MSTNLTKPIETEELQKRVELNFDRLANGDYYSFAKIFSPASYSWQGDKEGRALLAFACHYKISGQKITCMEQMLAEMGNRMNADGYLGPIYQDKIHEQQLSGHSWLLRGLCEHYELFGDEFSLRAIRNITENLFLTKRGEFVSYPVDREGYDIGGVSGWEMGEIGKWILSSDIGCAFMSIDGLSHAYCVLRDARIKELLDEMITVYLGIDKVKLRAQTHCTLTAARGMIRMYRETGDKAYLNGAKTIMSLYVNGGGMSLTYQNLNWWGRPDTWTEPCAIVDSMMLAGELYDLTHEEEYRTLAVRIYHNGLATAQRDNGGAGTDTIVLDGVQEVLRSQMYEASFCCTMRLAEGLWYVNEHRELFTARLDGCVSKKGRVYADGDILYAEVSGGAEQYAEHRIEIDGKHLCPIVSYYKVPRAVLEASEQRILF